MIRRPPRSTRTDTLFPYTTLFRSMPHGPSWFTRIGMDYEVDAPRQRLAPRFRQFGAEMVVAGIREAEHGHVANVAGPFQLPRHGDRARPRKRPFRGIGAVRVRIGIGVAVNVSPFAARRNAPAPKEHTP